MNPRIKELAEQAKKFANDTFNANPATYDRPGQQQVWNDMMQEKFAELIINDCIAKCEDKDPHPDQWSNQWEFTTSRTIRECVILIKKHFGVGE